MSSATDRMEDAAKAAKAAIEGKPTDPAECAATCVRDAVRSVQAHPFTSILVTFALGMVAGKCLQR